jgi:zinc finger protein
MSANGQSDQVTKTQNPDQFFQAIGNKVEDLAPATNGADTSDDRPPVEEIESLCMNCGKNVSDRLRLLSASQTWLFLFESILIKS